MQYYNMTIDQKINVKGNHYFERFRILPVPFQERIMQTGIYFLCFSSEYSIRFCSILLSKSLKHFPNLTKHIMSEKNTIVVKQQDGTLQLKRGNVILECSFRSPVVIPITQPLREPQFFPLSTACSSKCPHFDLQGKYKYDEKKVVLKCVNPATEIVLENNADVV